MDTTTPPVTEEEQAVKATPGWKGLHSLRIGPVVFIADFSLVLDSMIGFNIYRGGHVGYSRAVGSAYVHLGLAVGLIKVMLAVEIRGKTR